MYKQSLAVVFVHLNFYLECKEMSVIHEYSQRHKAYDVREGTNRETKLKPMRITANGPVAIIKI